MDTQVNFLALITTALNNYIEQQVTAALAKATPATPPVDETKIQTLIDAAVGEKIAALFEARIAEMISTHMDEAIEEAIEQHTRDEMHGDADAIADAVTDTRAFERAIESAIEEAMETHTSDYDHDELANINDKLDEDAVDAKLEEFVQRDEIKELVGEALAQTTFRLTTAG